MSKGEVMMKRIDMIQMHIDDVVRERKRSAALLEALRLAESLLRPMLPSGEANLEAITEAIQQAKEK